MADTQPSDSPLPSNDWLSAKWRPMMGWMYMTVCIFDFIIFPILWTSIQSYDPQGTIGTEWMPLTLKGGGLFHMSMGAVLGVAAWSRGQEKITAMNQGYGNDSGNSMSVMQDSSSYSGQTPVNPSPAPSFSSAPSAPRPSATVPQAPQPPL